MIRLFLLFLLFSSQIYAQDITAFVDYRQYLQVFDKGTFKRVEYLPLRSYKIGGKAVAIVDHKNDFRIYSDGKASTLVNAADFSYFTTDYLTSFKVGDVLYVFEKDEKKILSYYNTIFTVNDSLLAWFDDARSNFNIYYNGKTAVLEENFLQKPRAIKSGPNVLAWVNQSGFFNIFHHGTITTLDNIPPFAFEAGRDIAAWVDDYTRQFHLFYKGDTAVIETFAPDSFKVGFGIMAYVDQQNNFWIFHEGKLERFLSNRPEVFAVKGNVVAYGWNNMFNVFYKGETFTLQNRIPRDFQVGNDGVAWIDDSGRLNLFQKGKTYTVSYEIINRYFLYGNTLKWETGINTVNVFWEGKNYEQED